MLDPEQRRERGCDRHASLLVWTANLGRTIILQK
jgi:hypothetical protein